MASGYIKTCPDCGAENDSNDLFCKDCGTSLAMVPSGQTTAAFTPVSAPVTAQPTTVAPAITPAPASAPPAVSANYGYVPQNESVRGAVLGWIAATLMLMIVAAFLWSSVISEATRDRITGIF